MGKFTKLIKIIQIVISNPKVIGNILQYDKSNKEYVNEKYKISELPTVDLLDLFPDFDVKLSSFSGLGGGSSPLDYALLKKFAESIPCHRYFEIGTWLGESSSNVAKIADECISLSLSDEDLRQKTFYSEDMLQAQRFFSKKIKNIQHIFGDSKTFDFSKIGKFDLIFIDGNHSHDYVQTDAKNAFKLLKDENSVIVWHDYSNFTGDDINWNVFAGILDGCNKEQISHLYHVSNTMCAIYTRKNMKISKENFFLPSKNFEIQISTKQLAKE